MINKFMLVIILTINITVATGQTQVPNGSFENFQTLTNGGGFSWDMPLDWTESLVPNVFTRFAQGEGFFYKYDSTDAIGSALLMHRGRPDNPSAANVPINSGFIRFRSDSIPSNSKIKLTGRYKYYGADQNSVVDTFKIVAYYAREQDTLGLMDLHLREYPNNAEVLTITSADTAWKNFEIDLTKFSGMHTEYMTINFILKSGVANQFAYQGYSRAVVDDLNIIQVGNINLTEFSQNNPTFDLFPNPTADFVTIRMHSASSGVDIEIVDVFGKVVQSRRYDSIEDSVRIDIRNIEPGIYFIKVLSKGEISTQRVLKI